MSERSDHTRRDFLQGRAAAHTLVDKVKSWVDATSELLGPPHAAEPTLHAHASRRAMACEFAVQYHAADDISTDIILAAFDRIDELEDQMSIYRDHSEVIEVNARAADGPIEVESGLFQLLQLAARLEVETQGAFDITSTPLSRVWGFLRREGRLPSNEEIQQALQNCGYEHIELDPEHRTIFFRQRGIEINFNSIGKGYALDEAALVLEHSGVTDFLWHGGRSSVLAVGENRSDSRQAWTLGLRHPFHPERRIAEFYLRDRALATAGGATQFFEHEGKRFSHIIDPRTGTPADGVLTSTVVAPSAAEADALATAFFVMQREAVAEYCQAHPHIGAVLVCPTKQASDIAIYAFGMNQDDWTLLPVLSSDNMAQ